MSNPADGASEAGEPDPAESAAPELEPEVSEAVDPSPSDSPPSDSDQPASPPNSSSEDELLSATAAEAASGNPDPAPVSEAPEPQASEPPEESLDELLEEPLDEPIIRPREPLPTPTLTQDRARATSPTGRYLREGLVGALRQPFLRSLLKIPLKKVAIWVTFLGLIYALREFFGLIFLTFVISYISGTIVQRISPHFTNRKIPVVLVFSAIIGAVVSLGFLTIPRAVRQGEAQLAKMRKIKNFKTFLESEIASRFGAELPQQTPDVAPGPPRAGDPSAGVAAVGSALGGVVPSGTPPPVKEAPQLGLLQRARSFLNNPEINKAVAKWLAEVGQEYLLPNLKSAVQGIWGAAAYFIAALIFSFMIVWDLPRLAAGGGHLERSRLGDVWVEVAPSIATFFRLLGKAFEAQTVIALVNTLITAVGMYLLGIPGIPFLAGMVFVCSFIPIVGMFISTIPICLVALQVGGVGLVAGVIAMVAVAHVLEAYVLNPRIYGYHMKLHPLAVLIVLYLGQHLFGVWGLVIGVPMATYVWRHLILGETDVGVEPAEPGVEPAEPGVEPAEPVASPAES